LASSRSHCIFTVSLEVRAEGSSTVRRSKLHLVDLAGSERTGKTQSSGVLFREATHINKSLHFLELVIVALQEARKAARAAGVAGAAAPAHHIPYRNSLMTSVLRDSLGGNCKTTMIATINPEAEHTDESISTCRFAQRVARVKNTAVVNAAVDPAVLAAQLKARVGALEAELALRGGAETGPLSPAQRAALAEAARAWLHAPEGAELDLGKCPTLAKVRIALAAVRAAALEARAGGGACARCAAHALAGGDEGETPQPSPPPPAPACADSLAAALREEVARLQARLTARDRDVAALAARVAALGGAGEGGARLAHPPLPASAPSSPPRPAPAPTPAAPPPPLLLPNGAPADRALLRDKERACEAYRAAHPSAPAAADNKALLRARYDEAKAVAERVNGARAVITAGKAALEKARMERALSSLSAGGGGGGGGAAGEQGDAPLRTELEAQKTAYKVGFETLRGLKAEIEGIQRALEASRLRVQAEFEDWFAAAGGAAPASPPRQQHNASLSSAALPLPQPLPLNASFASVTSSVASVDSLPPPPPPPLGALPPNSAPQRVAAAKAPVQAVAVPARLGAPTAPPPAAAAAAGQGDVEDDIAAFYRLKTAAAKK
jgi:kinesin family protein 6/9